MQLTVVIYRQGGEEFLQVDVGSDMTLADIKAVIQADSNVRPDRQQLFYNQQPLTDDTKTLTELSIGNGDMIGMRVKAQRPTDQPAQQQRPSQQTTSLGGRSDSDMAEGLRMQAISNAQFLAQMRNQTPALAEAVNDSTRFRSVYEDMTRAKREADAEKERMIARLNDDPFDVEAQTKIEEMIREENVMRNYDDAVENAPEVFGRVHMLYIPVEVNGTKVKAFVDSGAQATIMSPGCAERCGIMRLIDKRFAGIARGVGTAKILGRVHSAQIKIGDAHLPASFTVMEGKDVELLLGLDMLKRHQGIIDLSKDSLIIQGQTVRFLPESELPSSVLNFGNEPTVDGPDGQKIGAETGAVIPPAQASSSVAGSTSQQGQVHGATSGSEFPPAHVEQLVGLGFSQEEAINALRATEGNLDAAAALLFG